MLDKVAGVLKKKRKNQRDTVKGGPRAFSSIFLRFSLSGCPLHCYFLAPDCLFPSSIVSHAFTGVRFTF